MVGVIDTNEALQRAREAGLDLVEVAADSDPPVCRIMDFGKWKYEQSKKEKAQKAKSKHTELKEVRMGRSMKIDPHDIQIRLTQARRFLMEGHKVQIVQNFRGREMVHRDRGQKRMADIIEDLSDVGKLETPPRLNGRRLTMIMAPDKAKIERIKRSEASSRKAEGKPTEEKHDAGEPKTDEPPARQPEEELTQQESIESVPPSERAAAG